VIDYKLILNDFEATGKRLARKGVEPDTLLELRHLLESRKSITRQLDELRSVLNRRSQEIGRLHSEGRKDEAEALRANVTDVKNEIIRLEGQAREVEEKSEYLLLRIPNMPSDDAPEGKGEEDNVVLRTHNYDEGQYAGKSFKPHWEVADALGIYDAERAAKISGAMFALLRKQGASLLRALINFGLALNQERYEEILPPHFVRTETFTATGHLPKFELDAYNIRDESLWAIPTGEVPLMSLHRDETLSEEELPKRYMAYTLCWRREAGSAGKDTRGMQRLHEFHKLELLKLCTPQQVQAEFESMLADAERPLQLLNLPYRVVDLCSKDLTFSSARIFDLEVYAPGVDKWLEVSSVGIFTDFQARRGNIRFKRGKGKPEFVHAINGSAIATPRLWAAIIEHGQQPDGSVRIPEALVPFFGSDSIKP
jgi:seryl-tRNA synthetase